MMFYSTPWNYVRVGVPPSLQPENRTNERRNPLPWQISSAAIVT
jgi:hypothetical protein